MSDRAWLHSNRFRCILSSGSPFLKGSPLTSSAVALLGRSQRYAFSTLELARLGDDPSVALAALLELGPFPRRGWMGSWLMDAQPLLPYPALSFNILQ